MLCRYSPCVLNLYPLDKEIIQMSCSQSALRKALLVILLAFCDLEAPVELLGKNEPCHEVRQGDVAEAQSSVGTGADFRGNTVASAYDDLQCAAAFFDVGNKIRRELL